MSLVGGRNQEVPIKLVARDENGNLAYIALIEENGTVLAQESCVPDMTAECTLVLTMTSPEGYGQRLRFSAVAVDQDGLRSETISFIVATNLPAVGGASESEPSPTPEASPTPESRTTTSSRTSVTLRVAPPRDFEPFIANITTTFQPRITYNGSRRLSYVLIDGPEGMEIDFRYGTVTWTPEEAHEGQTFDVTVLVSDGNKSTEASFQVTVVDPEELETEISVETLTVTDSDTTLQGLEITSAPDETPLTRQDLEELQELLQKVPPESVPAIPSWIMPISDVFVVKGIFGNPVVIRYPLSDFLKSLPHGFKSIEVNVYAFTGELHDAERYWSPVAMEYSLEGSTVEDLTLAVTLGGLQELAFVGYNLPDPPRPFEAVPVNTGFQLPQPDPHAHSNLGLRQTAELAEYKPSSVSPASALVPVSWVTPVDYEPSNRGNSRNRQQTDDCDVVETASLCVTPPDITKIDCSDIPYLELELSGIGGVAIGIPRHYCTYRENPDSDEPDSEITIWGFGRGCRWRITKGAPVIEHTDCPEGAAVHDLAAWAIMAQSGLEVLGMAHSKNIVIKIESMDPGKSGFVRPRLWEEFRFIHLSSGNFSPVSKRGTILHEYFHLSQVKECNENRTLCYVPLTGEVENGLWLIEGTAEWFEDAVDDGLNTYSTYGMPKIMEEGVNSKVDQNREGTNPYLRASFFKLLDRSCPLFDQELKKAFIYDPKIDRTGLDGLVGLFGNASCDFGDHLGEDRKSSLEAAISFYNFATLWKKDLLLLDSNEPQYSLASTPPRYSLAGAWNIPPAGAYSFVLNPQLDQFTPGEISEFVINTDREVIVSMATDWEGFIGTNVIGPTEDPEPHAWFVAPAESSYIYSMTEPPEVFLTIVNPSLISSANVQLEYGSRDETAEPLTTPVPETSEGIEADRAALVALYNATGGPNWTNSDGWLSDGPIGTWYGVVTDLSGRVAVLSLSKNELDGEIPADLGNLTNLNYLNLSFNQLDGEIPADLGNLTNLTRLTLAVNQLDGEMPADLGNLTNLTRLNLSFNQLDGEIPADLGSLTNLNYLYLFDNRLAGVSADSGNLANLASLRELDLSNNQLAEVPAELGSLRSLENLDLSDNLLAAVPVELGSLRSLDSLDLSNNRLAAVPVELGSLRSLDSLDLSNNRLAAVPVELGGLNSLDSLDLSNNQLTEVPVELGSLRSLDSLDLSNNQLTEVPVELGSLRSLDSLDLSNNRLTEVPVELENLRSLDDLDLSHNDLDGEIPSLLEKLIHLLNLDLSHNDLGGEIPIFLEKLENLVKLDLSDNGLDGAIPPELGKLTSLTELDLSDNYLDGEIPADLGALLSLDKLDLSHNQLDALPAELGNLTGLNYLHLGDNDLAEVPAELGNLFYLYELDLSDNDLDGEIPTSLEKLKNMTNLDLSDNDLDGAIPMFLGGLDYLKELDLSDNDLDGDIPTVLGDLDYLTILDLSDNALGGAIPQELGKLSNLRELDLSDNALDGEIPVELVKLRNLEKLFLSGNDDLDGCIPAALLEVDDNDLDELGLDYCADRDALVALYNATGGENWTDSTNWLTEQSIDMWHGVDAPGGRVTILNLSNNNLEGEIPEKLENLSNLTTLLLPFNNLEGEIPEKLGNLTNLVLLQLNDTKNDDNDGLTGTIPAELGDLESLKQLLLNNNGLTGTIPAELGNLVNLEQLFLNDNELSGTIPAELENLANLDALYLGNTDENNNENNDFTGCIPSGLLNIRLSDVSSLGLQPC